MNTGMPPGPSLEVTSLDFPKLDEVIIATREEDLAFELVVDSISSVIERRNVTARREGTSYSTLLRTQSGWKPVCYFDFDKDQKSVEILSGKGWTVDIDQFEDIKEYCGRIEYAVKTMLESDK